MGDLAELNEKKYSDLAEADPSDPLQTGELEASEAGGETRDSDTSAEDIELGDLEVVATLGVGGFGRVELVKVNSLVEIFIWILIWTFPLFHVSAVTKDQARCLRSNVCPSNTWWRQCSR